MPAGLHPADSLNQISPDLGIPDDSFRWANALVFGYAVEKGIVTANPVSAARKPRPGKRYDFLSEDEFAAMAEALTALEGEGVNPVGIAVLRLLLLTGARPSEIEKLRWAWHTLDGPFVNAS
jgi:integrase